MNPSIHKPSSADQRNGIRVNSCKPPSEYLLSGRNIINDAASGTKTKRSLDSRFRSRLKYKGICDALQPTSSLCVCTNNIRCLPRSYPLRVSPLSPFRNHRWTLDARWLSSAITCDPALLETVPRQPSCLRPRESTSRLG